MSQLPHFDIALVDNGAAQVEVRVRPDADFDGVFASIVFTIKWDVASGASLDTTHAGLLTQPFMQVSPSDVPGNSGGFRHQVFFGLGFTPLTSAGVTWTAGHEYTVCTINVLNGPGSFSIANDTWTQNHNGLYYASLNGYDQTGNIFDSPVPTVDIHSTPNGSNIDVAVRPSQDFFGTVSTLDFTLRWPVSNNTHLGSIAQISPESQYIPIQKTGGEVDAAGFRYQRFHGQGHVSLANSGTLWQAGVDRVVMSIPVTGSNNGLGIVNDAWTSTNSGDFAAILNGQPRTGSVDDLTTAIQPIAQGSGAHLNAFNNNGLLTILFDASTSGDLGLRLVNSAGQTIWNDQRSGFSGSYVHQVDNDLSEGVYILQVSHGSKQFTKSIVM